MNNQKILSREDLVKLRAQLKSQNKKVGFTSGVFDLLHPGHVDYLEKARILCDFLFVGVNSDSSVRQNKGDLRPIVSADDRVSVIAGLESVDFVFIFSEANNNLNVELLKPDIYIKAGDYAQKDLSSAPIVEAYGGKVELIPASEGFSSSKIIDKIINTAKLGKITAQPIRVSAPGGRVAFVDRDGTINEEVDYLSDPKNFTLIPGAIEGLKLLSENGFHIVVITNQPGIGLGYYSEAQLFKVNACLLAAAGKAGVPIQKIYFCPHAKVEGCACRKPEPGMLLRAKEELGIDLRSSVIIGDSTADIEAGKRAGCKTVLVETGKAGKDGLFDTKPDHTAVDLLAAAKLIVSLP